MGLLANRGSGGAINGVTLYDLPSGKQRWLFPIGLRGSGVIVFSNDGQRIVASDAFTHDLHLFDTASPTPVSKLTGHSDVPSGAFFRRTVAGWLLWVVEKSCFGMDGPASCATSSSATGSAGLCVLPRTPGSSSHVPISNR